MDKRELLTTTAVPAKSYQIKGFDPYIAGYIRALRAGESAAFAGRFRYAIFDDCGEMLGCMTTEAIAWETAAEKVEPYMRVVYAH